MAVHARSDLSGSPRQIVNVRDPSVYTAEHVRPLDKKLSCHEDAQTATSAICGPQRDKGDQVRTSDSSGAMNYTQDLADLQISVPGFGDSSLVLWSGPHKKIVICGMRPIFPDL